MNKILLSEIYRDYNDYEEKTFRLIKGFIPNAEWFKNSGLINDENLFNIIMLNFSDRYIRYDTETSFLKYFNLELLDILPDIYAKQQVFINNELSKFLSVSDNRAIRFKEITTGDKNNNNNSKTGESVTPTDLIVNSVSDIKDLNLTGAQISNLEMIENYNLNNENSNLNFVSDLKRVINNNFTLKIKEFVNQLNKHFSFIKSNYNSFVQDKQNYRFRNGYNVNDVDYLGVENQEENYKQNDKIEILERQVSNVLYYNEDGTVLIDNTSARKDIKVNLFQVASVEKLTETEDNLTEAIQGNRVLINKNIDEIIDINEIKFPSGLNMIQQIERDVKLLQEQNKNQTNLIIEGFSIGTSYIKNDYSYNIDNKLWYILKVDSLILENFDQLLDTNLFLPTNSPDNTVDPDNYYTKEEINSLLKPLETRLTAIESRLTVNEMGINGNKNQITLNRIDINSILEKIGKELVFEVINFSITGTDLQVNGIPTLRGTYTLELNFDGYTISWLFTTFSDSQSILAMLYGGGLWGNDFKGFLTSGGYFKMSGWASYTSFNNCSLRIYKVKGL